MQYQPDFMRCFGKDGVDDRDCLPESIDSLIEPFKIDLDGHNRIIQVMTN